MKKTYLVGVREVHVSSRRVEAESPEEAKKAASGIEDEVALEYSHTLPEDTWTVEVES